MIFKWIISTGLILGTMCLDNLFWIPDSPEWTTIKKNFWIIKPFKREYAIPKNKEGLKYCWKNRILEVLKHPRDLIPAVISGGILALIW